MVKKIIEIHRKYYSVPVFILKHAHQEILNMLDIGRKPFQLIPRLSLALNRKGKVFPLCNASFRSSNNAHRQASIARWVHPFMRTEHTVKKIPLESHIFHSQRGIV